MVLTRHWVIWWAGLAEWLDMGRAAFFYSRRQSRPLSLRTPRFGGFFPPFIVAGTTLQELRFFSPSTSLIFSFFLVWWAWTAAAVIGEDVLDFFVHAWKTKNIRMMCLCQTLSCCISTSILSHIFGWTDLNFSLKLPLDTQIVPLNFFCFTITAEIKGKVIFKKKKIAPQMVRTWKKYKTLSFNKHRQLDS